LGGISWSNVLGKRKLKIKSCTYYLCTRNRSIVAGLVSTVLH
jgi:hypothetical protein